MTWGDGCVCERGLPVIRDGIFEASGHPHRGHRGPVHTCTVHIEAAFTVTYHCVEQEGGVKGGGSSAAPGCSRAEQGHERMAEVPSEVEKALQDGMKMLSASSSDLI